MNGLKFDSCVSEILYNFILLSFFTTISLKKIMLYILQKKKNNPTTNNPNKQTYKKQKTKPRGISYLNGLLGYLMILIC